MATKCYDNRELSWLKFNQRVLEEAKDEKNPLCERLSFLSIFQSNLDEFFMVRCGSLHDQMCENPNFRENKTNMTCKEQLTAIYARVRELLRDKLAAWAQRGQAGRTVRVMVLGIPNVGKSTFINKVARRKTARAEDRPGVTRSKQWVPVDSTLELLDTPGILWPRFDDPEVGKRLAFTGAIKDDVVDMEELACYLMDYLGRRYAPVLEERYKIDVQPEDSGYDLLEKAGRKRGFLMRGAQVDTQRMARVLLDEFRGGKLGRFTLETVEDAQ